MKKLYEGNENMGIVELNLFFKSILIDVVPNFYNNGIYCFNCERDNSRGEHTYGTCIYSKDDRADANDKVKTYMYSQKNKKFVHVPIKLIQYLKKYWYKIWIKKKRKSSKQNNN